MKLEWEPGHYYMPDTPRENGYLFIEVTKDYQVRVVSPAVKWWRDRVFDSVEEFGRGFIILFFIMGVNKKRHPFLGGCFN